MARSPAPSGAKASRSYNDKRDFSRTPEPRGGAAGAGKAGSAPIFVVQKHDASRLHWDFRLEHDGVLWSWAVPKGPSLDPKDKRLAMHVEDHPVDYASFEGTIPEGNYGAGTVELWDQGHWRPLADDPAAALQKGELKFVLDGSRLHGGFVLVRLKPRLSKTGVPEKAESWLLIKEKDDAVEPGADAAALERKLPRKQASAKPAKAPRAAKVSKAARQAGGDALPETQAPQLATLVTEAPVGEGWVSEIKFDGYRMLCRRDGDAVRLFTRNGLDWTDRVPALAKAVAVLPAGSLLLDGELVALDRDGRTSFGALQDALSNGRTGKLVYYAFDLLHRDGRDLRALPLRERKQALDELLGSPREGTIRLSEHLASDAAQVRTEACKVGLEGIVCKRLDAPYQAGRSRDWLKLKCESREEAVIIGSTPPKGSRAHLGSLLLARHDPDGRLRFAGGVGTGFSAATLRMLDETLRPLASKSAPKDLQNREAAPRDARWVKPELVAELRFAGVTDDGMFRHASFLGLREDKPAQEVVAETVPKKQPASGIVTATKPGSRDVREVAGQRLTHPDRLLWPKQGDNAGVTKADLAAYWQAVAERALPEIADRPLALVRCPDGIAGEHFFQKHKTRGMPDALREGAEDDAPYLALSDVAGLVAAAQIGAIELHGWGSPGSDPAHADRLVFDLDPAEDVPFERTVAAALEVRRRLKAAGLECYPRTSGGKGLHVVAPISTRMDWDAVRSWCRGFAESMERDAPELFVSSTRKTRRTGRILIDWLRNGLGSTAVASYSPRARPGATVATPLAWREVTPKLDIKAFNIRTVPKRVGKTDPWRDFDRDRRELKPAKK